MDWQLATTIVSLMFGLVGTIFGCWSFFWTRKHRILDALSDILRKYFAGLRQLTDANNARRKAERLKLSFPNGGTNGDVIKRINELVGQYGVLIKEAEQTCRQVEIEIYATSFKFPDAIRKELASVKKDLFKLGDLVNRGLCDAADVQAGRVKDGYETLGRLARGWRLMNLFGMIIRTMIGASEDSGLERIKEQTSDSGCEFAISQERMDLILALLHKRMTSERQRSFAVHPPQQIIDNPMLIKGEINVDALHDLKFKVVFQDGEIQTLAIQELMFLTHQMIFVATEIPDILAKLDKGGFGPINVEVKTTVSVNDIMQPATVKALLEKIEFSTIPAEEI